MRKDAKHRHKAHMQTIHLHMKAAKDAFRQEKLAFKLQKRELEHRGRWSRHQRSRLDEDLVRAVAESTAGELQPAASAPPPETAAEEGVSPLGQLAEMGFENIELLAQLLERYGNNVPRVVEALERHQASVEHAID